MLHRTIVKIILGTLLMLSGLGCTMAEPAGYTGDGQTHERHDTGIDSQVADH